MLPVTFFRSSSYGRWDFCPLLYTAEYCLGLTGNAGLAANKGTCVHKVLEVMAVAKKECQQHKKKTNKNKDLTIKDDAVGEVNIWDYDVDQLIDKSYKYYSTNITYLDWKPKDHKEVKEWTHQALDYENGRFDPRNLTIVDAEPYFDFEVVEPWAMYQQVVDGKTADLFLRLKGTVDLIHQVNEDTIEVHDWKTGGSTKNWATGELRDQQYFQTKDFQLRLYHYAATQLYPWAKNILTTIYFIRGGGPFTVCFTEQDVKTTKEMIRERFDGIRKCENPYPRKGWHCNLCHMKKQSFSDYGVHADKTKVEFRSGKFAKRGEKMKMCDQLSMEFGRMGCKRTIEEYRDPNFTIGHYHDPGSV